MAEPIRSKSRKVKRAKQRSMYCSCGAEQLKAAGLCGTCYTG